MQDEATLIPMEGILVPTGYKDGRFPVLVLRGGEEEIILPLLAIGFKFREFPDYNLHNTTNYRS
jgi:hypothetical protein